MIHIIKLAQSLDLPIIVGTEMNSPGLKFVDDFDSEELKPFAPLFLKGAHIVYAHSIMQKQCSMGYTSKWANENFKTSPAKNDFFETVGRKLQVANEDSAAKFKNSTPEQILTQI